MWPSKAQVTEKINIKHKKNKNFGSEKNHDIVFSRNISKKGFGNAMFSIISTRNSLKSDFKWEDLNPLNCISTTHSANLKFASLELNLEQVWNILIQTSLKVI